jgi:hypothetical protein
VRSLKEMQERFQRDLNAHLLGAVRDALESTPIPMILFCPNCLRQHIDRPAPAMFVQRNSLGEIYRWLGQSEFQRRLQEKTLNTGTWEVLPPWTNPPHKSHECQHCMHVWRPCDHPTVGVESINTKGKKDRFAVPPYREFRRG